MHVVKFSDRHHMASMRLFPLGENVPVDFCGTLLLAGTLVLDDDLAPPGTNLIAFNVFILIHWIRL